jgi:hypothetical protein
VVIQKVAFKGGFTKSTPKVHILRNSLPGDGMDKTVTEPSAATATTTRLTQQRP